MKITVQLCLLLLLAKSTIQAATPRSPSYTAAVVEYHSVIDKTDGKKAAEANADYYKTIMKKAAQSEADIIVFPEYGLTSAPFNIRPNASEYRKYYRNVASRVPDPTKKVSPCDDSTDKYSQYLKSISCAAKEFKMYVVINHMEKVDCPPVTGNNTNNNCSADGFLLYNANAVFDREGRLISRYRKFNLYNEPGTNTTKEPEVATFKTDFNVTFGQLICIDLFRHKPTHSYIHNPNVTDVVFTTHWYDEKPFAFGTEVQAGFAHGADVNLLVSDGSNVMTGTTGSGIYAGKSGPIRVYRSRVNSNALVVSEVPRIDRNNRIEDVQVLKSSVHVFSQEDGIPTPAIRTSNNGSSYLQENLSPYTTQLVDPEKGDAHIEKLCDRGICCRFHVETSFDKNLASRSGISYYRYRMAVFSGVKAVANVTSAGVEICAVIACAGDELADCNKEYPVGTKIAKPLKIKMLIITREEVNTKDESFYQPLTMNLDGLALNSSDYIYVKSGHKDKSNLLLNLNRPKDDLSTFGIFGRKFDRDGKQVTSSATWNAQSLILVILTLVLTRCLQYY